MYLNIKNRYRYRPEMLIKHYKLYFNKMPKFETRLTENYDPDEFLFNFEEFKEEFKEIINLHQVCGAMCIHLRRFYERVEQLNHTDRKSMRMSQMLIDKIPKLLEE